MVTCFTGVPGSGKSLDTMREIERALKYGHNVIANFGIALPKKLLDKSLKLRCIENEDVTPEYFYEYAKLNHAPRRENQTLIVIDECQLKFKSDFMTRQDRKDWEKFFSQHRKLGYNILLVTQSIRKVDRTIRDVIELETKHFKLCNYPTKSILLGIIFLIIKFLPINVFMSVTSWDGLKSSKYLIRNLFLYKPKYGKMYDTFKMFGEPASEGEQGTEDESVGA